MKSPERTLSSRPASIDEIEEVAAAWLARRYGGFSLQDSRAFQAWLAADPRHASAVTHLEQAWQVVCSPGAAGQGLPVTVTVLPQGSMYRYWDTGVSPGATWTDPAFLDVAWETGAAPLGYNDAHIATTVDYGFNANAKYITTWFRTAFDVKGEPSVI